MDLFKNLQALTTNHRKLITYCVSIAALFAGLCLSLWKPEAGVALYGIYAAGIGTAQGIFTIGNVKETRAKEETK